MKLYYRKLIDKIKLFLDDDEIIVIQGARQVGKTSVLKYLIEHVFPEIQIGKDNVVYFNLEDFDLLELCNSGVKEVLNYLKTTGVDFNKRVFLLVDEIQYLENPSNFLKLFFDEFKTEIKLIVTGSSSFNIKKKFKDSLVGRTIEFKLFSLDFEEFLNFKNEKIDFLYNNIPQVINKELSSLFKEYLIYGSYPAIVLENDTYKKEVKLKQIINTYIRKDIRDIGNIKNIVKFNRLLRILASQSGKLLNISELANTVGISKQTVEQYIFILENTFILKLINPFHKNIRSELTKMPKIFFEDTGIMNILINRGFNKNITGEIFETGIFSLIRKNVDDESLYFWRTNKKQEIDFIFNNSNLLIPLETKIRFLNKHKTSLFYFKNIYSIKDVYVCSLEKGEGSEYDFLKVLYPWELYNFFN